MSGCPAEQDIPRYLDAVARGDFELAWRVITATNPFPNVQGMACNHQCQSRCTRINYDKPLMIREVKRFVAEKMAEAASGVPAAQTGKRAAVIGAGPAGCPAPASSPHRAWRCTCTKKSRCSAAWRATRSPPSA